VTVLNIMRDAEGRAEEEELTLD